MTNPFDQALIAANDAFFNAMGETVTLYPDGETERSVTAMIEYEGVEQSAGLHHGKGVAISVAVANDAATGLSTDEYDSGTAMIDIPERIGKSTTKKRLSKIISQDAAMVTYKVG